MTVVGKKAIKKAGHSDVSMEIFARALHFGIPSHIIYLYSTSFTFLLMSSTD